MAKSILGVLLCGTTLALAALSPATAWAERTVRGRVTVKGTGAPVRGLIVRAKDDDGASKNDDMGFAVTDSDGRFRITYRKGKWDSSLGHGDTRWRPDIFIVGEAKARKKWTRVFKSDVHRNHRNRADLTINVEVPPNRDREVRTTFDARRHGFRFSNTNRRICALPSCKAENVSIETAKSISPAVLSIAAKVARSIGSFEWGLCGGMSLVAVRRYLSGKNDTWKKFELRTEKNVADVGRLDPKLKKNLARAQVDMALSKWHTYLWWQSRPSTSKKFDKHSIGHETKQEWWELKKQLDKGYPTILGLIRAKTVNPADFGKVAKNHQVVATGYRFNDFTNEVTVFVYDPNHPVTKEDAADDRVEIKFNIGLKHNELNMGQYDRYLFEGPERCEEQDAPKRCAYNRAMNQVRGEVTRGFFIMRKATDIEIKGKKFRGPAPKGGG